MKFVATKKGLTTNFFHPSHLLLYLDPGCDVMAWRGTGRSYHVLAVASKNLKIITLKPMQDQTEDTGKKKT